jgi:hypothetical protein
MMYDLPSVTDYGKATDTSEHRLRTAIAKRDAAMTVIEISRHECTLPKDVYIMFKIIHGNKEADAHRYAYYLRSYGRIYYGQQSGRWMQEVHAMEVQKPSLKLVWQHWHNVLAARKEYESIPVDTLTDKWGCDKITIVSRAKIDAELAVDRAAAVYDTVLRAFEGRAKKTWEQTLTLRVKPPKQKLVVGRVRSSPTGYTKTGKYETRADGVRIPIVRKQ